MKKPRLKRDWEGRYVRLRGEHCNKGGGIFRDGEIMLVERNYGGLHLARRKQCPLCKEHYFSRLNRVQERDVVLLPEDYVPEEHPSTSDALRAEVERLRCACLKVRKWGIELASLQPEMREQRFVQLWPHINQTLRAAVYGPEGKPGSFRL